MTRRAWQAVESRCREAAELRWRRSQRRRGTILIVVLLILFGLSAMVLVLCRSARVEAMASANHVAAAQAAAVARGAEQYVLALAAQQPESVLDLPESDFAAVPVGEAGYFWIIRPDYADPQLPIYGLVDEASKINLNTASADMMIALGMPQELAYSVIDWRDSDSETSSDGAEDQYYLVLPNPYHCKNGPLETVEELLLIRGAYPELVYGYGYAANGRMAPGGLRPGQGRGAAGGGVAATMSDALVSAGLFDFLTVYSNEGGAVASAPPQQGPGGESGEQGSGGSGSGQQGSVNLNNLNDRATRDRLRQLLRDAFGETRAGEIMGRIGGRERFRDIFDFYLRVEMTPDELSQIEGQLAASDRPVREGRINVNTAPREVLMALPGLDENDVNKLVSERLGVNTARDSIAWVAEALGQKAVGLGELITVRSYQYSVDIVAASPDGRAYRRVRAVIDASDAGGPPRIVYRRDLTERGWPLDPGILESLRRGEGPGAAWGTGGGIASRPRSASPMR